jgi:hypothetical protein
MPLSTVRQRTLRRKNPNSAAESTGERVARVHQHAHEKELRVKLRYVDVSDGLRS